MPHIFQPKMGKYGFTQKEINSLNFIVFFLSKYFALLYLNVAKTFGLLLNLG